MSTDHMILGGAAVVFVLALLYAMRSRKTTAKAALQSLAASVRPAAAAAEATSVQLFADAMSAIEKDGVKKAVARIVDQFAESHAADYKARVQGIVSPPKADPPAPAPPSPPAASGA